MSKAQQQTDMTPDEVTNRIWELAKKIDICMFTTVEGNKARARPLSARVYQERHKIYFMVDIDGAKLEQIENDPTVTLAWADNGNYKYVTVSGRAAISNDRALIKELWEKTDRAWWDDENDPSIRVITVSPVEGELWDSPTKVVATVKMVAGAITGAKPEIGDNAKVRM
jgi:general stress protein 26